MKWLSAFMFLSYFLLVVLFTYTAAQLNLQWEYYRDLDSKMDQIEKINERMNEILIYTNNDGHETSQINTIINPEPIKKDDTIDNNAIYEGE